MTMTAPVGHPVLAAIAERWSPKSYEPRDLDEADLCSLFEAARWAPSSFNEQPWRFVVVRREQAALFGRALEGLVDANRAWACDASALVFAIASLNLARNGRPNSKALYDLGQAMALLSVEAAARGLAVHQMGGILPESIAALCGVPEGFQVVTAAAIGYPAAEPEGGGAARSRRPLRESVFGATWGQPAEFLG